MSQPINTSCSLYPTSRARKKYQPSFSENSNMLDIFFPCSSQMQHDSGILLERVEIRVLRQIKSGLHQFREETHA
jgi:hypothetical protein